MNAVGVDTKVSRHTEPGIDSCVGRPPNENREYIATAESFLGGDSFAGLPLKLGGEVRSQEDEVEQLITGSPFLDLESPVGVYEGIKCTIMFPVVILKWLILLVDVILATIGLRLLLLGAGSRQPLGPVRALLIRRWIQFWAFQVLFICGFYSVRVTGLENFEKGKHVGAIMIFNHISYVDPLALVALLAPSGVAKSGVSELPFIGAFAIALQFLFVARRGTGDKVTRHTLPVDVDVPAVIASRAADIRYPPMMIAPEATTKPKECLLRFRRGAFTPGRPVLPVLLRYKSRHFNPGWGVTHSTPFHLWRLLSQFVNHLSIEILPPYIPSETEKQDASVYAASVRKLMAEALQVPLIEQGVSQERRLLELGISPGPLGRRLIGVAQALDKADTKKSL